ncbi:MAG: DUF4870 domain-containing protein [bacterium]|nr:DUF4870 domain-containing protein [bacterium]
MTTEPLPPERMEPEPEHPDDNARVSRLSSPPARVDENGTDDNAAEATIREYQARYQMPRTGAADMPDEPPLPFMSNGPRERSAAPRYRPRSYSTLRVSDDERLWASVAHVSAWITFLGGIFTIGTIIPVSIFIPLVIYFLFRRKSDYVAFHALQAFVIQLIGTVGAAVLLLAGGMVWSVGMIIAVISLVLLVGVVLVPLWALIGVALLLVVLLLPLGMVLFATIAAIATFRGEDYHYPFIARWVDRQLAGGFMNMV